MLVDQGVVEVTLLGQNVNSYGRDITKRRPLFAELLREVGQRGECWIGAAVRAKFVRGAGVLHRQRAG